LQKIVNERITDRAEREQRLASIEAHAAKGEQRHFDPLPQLADGAFLKRAFKDESESWSDQWFEEDGAWPEMTRLAERISSAM